jgi:hypothetical protein
LEDDSNPFKKSKIKPVSFDLTTGLKKRNNRISFDEHMFRNVISKKRKPKS